jgi:hypothetical protein
MLEATHHPDVPRSAPPARAAWRREWMPASAVERHRRTRSSSASKTITLAWFNAGCHSVPMRDSGRLGLRARARWGPNFFLFRKSHPINILRRKVGRQFGVNEIASQLGRAAQLSMARHPRGRGFEPGHHLGRRASLSLGEINPCGKNQGDGQAPTRPSPCSGDPLLGPESGTVLDLGENSWAPHRRGCT